MRSGLNFYVIDLKNIGGLVMPVIFEIEYVDGSKEELRIPAEIWRYNNNAVSKLIMTPKEIRYITLDPHLETADVDLGNNAWPAKLGETRVKLEAGAGAGRGGRGGGRGGPNPMREAAERAKKQAEADDKTAPSSGATKPVEAGAPAPTGGQR